MSTYVSFFLSSGFRCRPLSVLYRNRPFVSSRVSLRARCHSKDSAFESVESTNVRHSNFLAEASPSTKWAANGGAGGAGMDSPSDDFDSLTEGKGKLSPTSSHLFKLILPLGRLSQPPDEGKGRSGPESKAEQPPSSPPPTVILLHPSQPLSHAARLILASLAPATPTISFRSTSPAGQTFQWSDSTDVGDFIRDAARAAGFSICIAGAGAPPGTTTTATTVIDVEVPTFADRTRFLRRRLAAIKGKLEAMEGLKRECDREAHRGAKRMAMGGFGMLIVYWGAVARLTFWDYGWDVMEPITYLSGLSTVICGYLWFLYQGREVSYSSVLDRSISARREALYKARGLDIEHWMDLMSDARSLRKEIARIAEDYDENRKTAEKDEEGEEVRDRTEEDGDGSDERASELEESK